MLFQWLRSKVRDSILGGVSDALEVIEADSGNTASEIAGQLRVRLQLQLPAPVPPPQPERQETASEPMPNGSGKRKMARTE